MGTVGTFGNLFGSRLAIGVTRLSYKNSYCRILHQTVIHTSSMTNTTERSTISAIPFSTSTSCNKYKDITDEKKLKATKIKKLHRENKELYGELLESSSKAKRLKKASAKKVTITEEHIHVGKSEKLNTVPPKSTNRGKSDSLSPKKVGKSSKGFLKDIEVTLTMNPMGSGRHNDGNIKQLFQDKSSVDIEEGKGPLHESMPSVKQLMATFYQDNVASMNATMETSPKKRRMKAINRDAKSNSKQVSNPEPFNTNEPFSSPSFPDDPSITKINLTINGKDLINESQSNNSSLNSDNVTNFPFDNPERVFFEDETCNPSEIISIPFPRQSSINTSSSTETISVPSVRLPSVSKILNATMPKEQAEALEKWQQKMIEKLGEEGFRKYKQDILNNGTELHSQIYSLLSGIPADQLSISKSISGHWSSLQGILSQVERVHILESHVAHPQLNYCGIVDCIAVFRDKLVVIDWKTSQKPKPYVSMTYDTPLQIAAYIGAINYDPNYSIKVTEGLIAIAYENGHNSQVFHLNPFEVSRYWKMWLNRLHLYETQVQLPSSVPFTASTSQTTSS